MQPRAPAEPADRHGQASKADRAVAGTGRAQRASAGLGRTGPRTQCRSHRALMGSGTQRHPYSRKGGVSRTGRSHGSGEHHTSTAPSTSARARADASACGALARRRRRGVGAGIPRHRSHGLRSPLLPHPPRGGPGAFRFQQARRLSPPLPALR